MYARSTTIKASPASIDRGIAFVREQVMPTVMGMEGCVGLSLLVNRDSGRCIATTSWASKETMHATNNRVQAMREQGTEAFDGRLEGVQEWEIATLHREHATREGTCVRVSWLRGDVARLDLGIEAFRTRVLPTAEQLKGFCSASLMVDRTTGLMAGATAWDNRKAMESSRDAATKLRRATAEETGGEIEDVAEFDLVIAHLRVPELV